MKKFKSFLRKEFYHIIRDRRTLLILIGMPMGLVILFGFAITNEINQAEIVIMDHSKDLITEEITDKILASGYFKINGDHNSKKHPEQIFQEGKVKMIVVFSENFAQKLLSQHSAGLQLLADATDPNIASSLVNYLNAIVLSYQQEINAEGQAPLQIHSEVRMLYNPEMESTYYFVPGVITIILMLVSAMMTSITIAREKEFGTMEILLASPLKPVTIILGKSLPYVALAITNALTILAIGYLVFDMPLGGNMLLLLMELLLFVITSLALGILISSIAETQQTALFISLMALMLPTILLSGFIFPIESMPWILQFISNAVPAKWFNIIIKNIMLKNTGIETLWDETLILIGMTLFFILLSIKKFKIRLE